MWTPLHIAFFNSNGEKMFKDAKLNEDGTVKVQVEDDLVERVMSMRESEDETFNDILRRRFVEKGYLDS